MPRRIHPRDAHRPAWWLTVGRVAASDPPEPMGEQAAGTGADRAYLQSEVETFFRTAVATHDDLERELVGERERLARARARLGRLDDPGAISAPLPNVRPVIPASATEQAAAEARATISALERELADVRARIDALDQIPESHPAPQGPPTRSVTPQSVVRTAGRRLVAFVQFAVWTAVIGGVILVALAYLA